MEKFSEYNISLDDMASIKEDEVLQEDCVAVIGMSVRTASGGTQEFWEDIKNGCNMISKFRGRRKEDMEAYHACVGDQHTYADGSFIKEIDMFDHKYFHMTPKEAQLMDPCQRLFLENTIHAIEDAGYGNRRLDGTNTRMFIGYAGNIKDSYLNMIWHAHPDKVQMAIVNNMNGMLGGRLSQMLNTHGVSEIIDATCASSLIAVHEGCESIIHGECVIAIVGGMRINLMPIEAEAARIGVESKDYQTRTLDEHASGFGEGDGVATLILKSYAQAVQDRDDIYAVIKASAVSQGGSSMGLTVTNPIALKDTVANTLLAVGHDIDTVGMFEMHGTATNLGDPIEMKGMTEAFRQFTDKRSFCAIGSLKSNIGHLYEASGIMGLVKTILSLKHKVIPPTIHLTEPNKEIFFMDSPFYVNTKAREWYLENGKRSAMVNSLGLNGSNCCVLLEEADEIEINDMLTQPVYRFLVLSAITAASLQCLANNYQKYLADHEVCMDDLCYTAAIGRWHYEKRVWIEFQEKEELLDLLNRCRENLFLNGANTVLLTNNAQEHIVRTHDLYHKVQQQYLGGEDVEWEEYFQEGHSHKDYKIIHLPCYPFEKKRCWIDCVSTVFSSDVDFAYGISWKQLGRLQMDASVEDFIFIGHADGQMREYQSYLESKNILVKQLYLRDGENIDVSAVAGYRNVLFFTDSLWSEDELDEAAVRKYLFMLFQICRASNLKYLGIVANSVHLIEGTEIVEPKDAAIIAAAKAIQREKETLKVHVIETDLLTPKEMVLAAVTTNSRHIALRSGRAFQPFVSKKQFLDTNEKEESVISQGTYLVTAGTSLVTLAVCIKIANMYPNSTFIFLARKLFDYDSRIESLDSAKNDEVTAFLKQILDSGCRVLIKKAEICQIDQMKAVLSQLEDQQIIPEYLIHSAGNGTACPYQEMEEAQLSAVLDPKIKALQIIECLFGKYFKGYVMFSSVAVTFMAPMQSVYIAANAYLDCFCEKKRREGKKAISLQWSTWKEIGMAYKNNIAYDLIFQAMTTEQALNYFEQIIRQGINGSVMIGALNLTPMGRRMIENSQVYIAEGTIPLKSQVKIKSAAVAEPELTGRKDKEGYTVMEKRISDICRDVLGYTSINIHENFFEMGADSLQVMNLHKQIDKVFPGKLELKDMFAYSNVYKLANYLCGRNADEGQADVPELELATHSGEIAIVGIAAKIPGAQDLEEFYEQLLFGHCFIGELPEWRKVFLQKYMRYIGRKTENVSFLPGAYLEDLDKFDYTFFHLSPREASLMDPHQRLYLELAVEAVEDAGYSLDSVSGTKTGVFLGFGTNMKDLYMRFLSDVQREDVADAIVGNTQAVLAGRVSHDLNLKGTSMVIDTACSSSIVALNTAIQSINSGQIDAACVGGVKLILCPVDDSSLYKIGMESDDGYTRTFDQTATGTAFSESAQMIFIKPYDQAKKDRDHIYGVIKSVAVNQDGNSAGVTAPNPISQKEVILEAWKKAGIHPEDIGYVEVHGTATRLGDTIEYQSLNEAFAQCTDKKAFCAVNSVKPNCGHMSEGAGLFGLIKGLKVLEHGLIPKNILFDIPNQSINMINSAMYYNTKNIKWEERAGKRTFVLSNFGMSGTNTHLVIEEAKQQQTQNILRSKRIVFLSNQTEYGLETGIKKMYQFLLHHETDFHNLCYTLAVGRNHYEYRMAIVCENMQQLQTALKQYVESKKIGLNVYFGHKRVVLDNRSSLKSYELRLEEQERLTRQASVSEQEEEKAKLYCEGAIIDYSGLFSGEILYRICLPAYSFDKKSCWLQIAPIYEIDEQLYYTMHWKPEMAVWKTGRLAEPISYIMFADTQDQKHQELIEAFHTENEDMVYVYDYKTVLEKYSAVEGIMQLLSEKKEAGISGIIYLLPSQNSVYNDKDYQLCLHLFCVVKALLQSNNISQLQIITISYHVFRIAENEAYFQPLEAIAHGINRVIALELPNVASIAIDTDLETDSRHVVRELQADRNGFYTCFRKNVRYVEEIVPENLVQKGAACRICSDGVYVITGGTGGIGLYYAKCLAEAGQAVKIALISKTRRYEKQKEVMDKIAALRALGAAVYLFVADVCNREKISRVFMDIKKEYGPIRGVIHAAGNASAQIIATKSEEEILKVMKPKYEGTWNVFQEIKDEQVDFFVLCSSGCTLTGEASQADYVAANQYLDAFTHYANQQQVRTHCINFSSWKSEGMSVRYQINKDSFFRALDNSDAKKAFFDVINSDNERCFVGKINADFCREYAVDLKSLPFQVCAEIEAALAISDGKNKIELMPNKMHIKQKAVQAVLEGKEEAGASYSETEIVVAGMFQKLLGIDTIHIQDSFFELGGDSILLGRLHSLIEQEYPSKMKLLDLFTYSSVQKIAEYLTAGGSSMQKDDSALEDEIDDLVKRFEKGEISIDEMLGEIAD